MLLGPSKTTQLVSDGQPGAPAWRAAAWQAAAPGSENRPYPSRDLVAPFLTFSQAAPRRAGGHRQTGDEEVSMAPITYGYARVSTREQNLDRQLRALADFGVRRENIFADQASGRDFERPAWIRLRETLREGDLLVVKSIDRFGRSYDEILDQWRAVTRVRGAEVVVLDMPLLDTRQERGGVTGALISDIVLQLLSYVAQVERESIHQRQAEGIAAAKARGVKFGRPRKTRPGSYGALRESYLAGRITRSEAASRLMVSVSTFDKWLRQDRETMSRETA